MNVNQINSFANKLNLRKVKTRNFRDNTSMKTYKITKKNNHTLKYTDLSKLVQVMEYKATQRGNPNAKFGLRGLAPDGWKTLKAMDSDLMSQDDYDDYFVNKVSNSSKFSKFYQVQLYAIS
jgi:hypothetical protein